VLRTGELGTPGVRAELRQVRRAARSEDDRTGPSQPYSLWDRGQRGRVILTHRSNRIRGAGGHRERLAAFGLACAGVAAACVGLGSCAFGPGAPLTLDVQADHYQLLAAGDGNGATVVQLEAITAGGVAPYAYQWSVIDPTGASDNGRLSALDQPTVLFTSGTMIGPYEITCAVADVTGVEVRQTVILTVGSPVTADIQTNRENVASGGGDTGQAIIVAKPSGGTRPYAYRWTALDPDGAEDSARLDAIDTGSVTFTSGDRLGTYTVQCAITDAGGTPFTDSVSVTVANLLSVDVAADRQQLSLEGGTIRTAKLSVFATGGTPPYTYTWSATAPDGSPGNERLNTTTGSAPQFVSASTSGVYRVACTVNDADGRQLTDSVLLLVGPGLSLTVTTSRKEIAASGGGHGTAQLEATVFGGTEPFTYAWSVIGPDGQPANDRLDDVSIPDPIFTSTTVLGTYRLFCTVTDAEGRIGFDSAEIYVGQPISVDVTTSRQDVQAGGGQATLMASVTGGLPPYVFQWSVSDPSGAVDNARLDSLVMQSTTFTSGLTTGTYTVTCVVTDDGGFADVDSVSLVVGGGLGQGLALDVTTNRQNLPATGGTASLAAIAAGGVAPLAYQWTVLDPSGADVTLATLNDDTIPGPTFTAPAAVGTYRLSCTVTDSVGTIFTDSTDMFVGQGLSLNLDVDRVAVVPGGVGANARATLTATPSGGLAPYTYAWSVTAPGGGADNLRLDDTAAASPVFTSDAANTVGTYRLQCVVTDSLGSAFVDSLVLFVGVDLSAAITATRQTVDPGGGATGQSTLTCQPYGGAAPYTYTWTVTNPSGVGEDARLDNVNTQSPVFTSIGTIGTYRLTCTVVDALGFGTIESTYIDVTDGLSATLTTSRLQVAPGGGANGQTLLTATPEGGIAPYTYQWAVTDPAGNPDNARLTDVNATSPTFESDGVGTVGTYRITCTITDSFGATFTDALHVAVGNTLSGRLTTSRSSVLPTGGGNDTALLTATPIGGTAPYTYLWTVINPSSVVEDARLDDTGAASPTFTSAATTGTYQLICTITDAAGDQFTDSLHIDVDSELAVGVLANRVNILPGGGANGQVLLAAEAIGGSSPYTYSWEVTTPAGAADNSRLDDDTAQAPVFTSNATVGTYRVKCTVTDSLGDRAVDAVHITVGNHLSAALTASRTHVLPGGGANGQSTLNAEPLGGLAPYAYSWSVTTPAGATDNTRLDDTAAKSPIFESNAGGTVGTYRIQCTVTDAQGWSFTDALHITVGDGLALSVTASRTELIPGGGANGQATLAADALGGTSPYTYAWTVTTPSGGTDNTYLSSTSAQSVTFTSDAVIGTFRVQCMVTDAAGARFADAVHLTVSNNLSVTVTSDRTQIQPNGGGSGQATLTATPSGGDAPYSYAWTVTTPTGGTDNARLDDRFIQSPTFTSTATLGVYRLTCVVTDSLGITASDSVLIDVDTSMSVALTASAATVLSGGGGAGQSTLTATPLGGLAPYTYSWSVTNPSGGAEDARLDDTAIASPLFTSAGTTGTYRLTCTVTDAAGQAVIASVHIQVVDAAGATLLLDVRADVTSALPGDIVDLTGDITAGTASYDYVWRAYDEADADQDSWGDDDDGGTVGAQQINRAGDVTQTWTVPQYASGVHRIVCVVTDAGSNTATDTIEVNVPTETLTLTTPAARDFSGNPTSVIGPTLMGSLATVVDVDVDLTYARNLRVRLTDPDAALGSVWIEVAGISAQGYPQAELFNYDLSFPTTAATVEGVKPFARVDTVRYIVSVGNPNGNETVQIGVANIFGLPRTISSAAGVRRVLRLPAEVLTTPADYSVITTAGQQGVNFDNPSKDPNGTNSYEILYDAP
jgi:hypothetical protein